MSDDQKQTSIDRLAETIDTFVHHFETIDTLNVSIDSFMALEV